MAHLLDDQRFREYLLLKEVRKAVQGTRPAPRVGGAKQKESKLSGPLLAASRVWPQIPAYANQQK